MGLYFSPEKVHVSLTGPAEATENPEETTMNVEQLTTAQIVKLYNSVSEKPVNKFADRSKAVSRLQAQIDQRGLCVVLDEEGAPYLAPVLSETMTEATLSQIGLVSEPTIADVAEAASDPAAGMPLADYSETEADVVRQQAVETTTTVEQPTVVEAAAVVRKQRGPAPMHADEDTITVNAGHNPKRKGSASHARFEILMAGDMTVGDYLDRCVALQGGKREKYRADVRWDHAHGFVGSYTPRQLANSAAGRDMEDDGQAGA